jgi:uncharacterized membrane protein YvbJ
MDYEAMTVNERLFRSGLVKDFDSAVERKDKELVIEILERLKVDDASIQEILKFFDIV